MVKPLKLVRLNALAPNVAGFMPSQRTVFRPLYSKALASMVSTPAGSVISFRLEQP